MFSPACASITPPVTRIPDRAVINPTESTFLASSYVNVPAIDTLPVNVASTADTFPVIETPVFVVSKRFVLLKYKSWLLPELNTADVLLPAKFETSIVPDLIFRLPVPVSSI